MTSPFSGAKFKALQKEWYEKLSENGFKDIEDNRLEEPPLKVWDNFKLKNLDVKVFAIQKHYFEAAERLLDEYQFVNELEKSIWALHAAGQSVRKISKEIKGLKKKSQVSKIICKISKEIK